MQVLKSDELDTDLIRLKDLVKRHGLSCRTNGASYQFDDRVGEEAFTDGDIYTARGLTEALAFAEGFDRAGSPHEK
jgi:hypothetical protein